MSFFIETVQSATPKLVLNEELQVSWGQRLLVPATTYQMVRHGILNFYLFSSRSARGRRVLALS